MSGYLQRMVATGAGRAESVHPRTGSLFAPHPAETATPSAIVEEHETAAAADGRAQEAQMPPRLERAEPVPARAPQSSYVPLVPEIVPRAQANEPASAFPIAAPLTATGPAPAGDDQQPPDTRVGRAGAVDDPGAVMPIGSRTGDTSSSIAPTRIVVESHGRAAPPARPRHEQGRAQADRQADDIQIHIGRIEVTAVAPPAPRASRPRDRTPSLDEYLNRRRAR